MRSRTIGFLLAACATLSILLFVCQGCSRIIPKPVSPKTSYTITKPLKHKHKIAFVMKRVGIPYTDGCESGMNQAASELGINAVFLGPYNSDDPAAEQVKIIESQITAGVNAIVISPSDAELVKPVIKKAISKGIKVFTWDSDAPGSGRIFYVCAVDDVGIGNTLIDHIAEDIGGKGKVAIVSGSAHATDLNQSIKGIEAGVKKYPGIKTIKPYVYNKDDQDMSIQGSLDTIKANPDLAAIVCVTPPGVPGVARAVVQAGKEGKIKIWGLSMPGENPDENREFIKKDIINGLVYRDPAKLTYLTTKLVNDYLDGMNL